MAEASTFADEGIVKSRKRKGGDVGHAVAWERHVEAERPGKFVTAPTDGADEVLAAFRKRRRKEGKQKQKQKQGAAAAAAAGESAVQAGEQQVDGDTLLQKRTAKTCSILGCIANAVARGVCTNHSSAAYKYIRPPCSMPGCKSLSQKDLLCQRHGAFGICTSPICITMAKNRSGRCIKHGANGFCTVEGCATIVKSKGLCANHSAVKPTRQPCCMPGCKSRVVKDLLCKKHGAYGVCIAPTCITMARSVSGLCNKHGAVGFCSVEECATAAISKGLCWKHGGGTRTRCNSETGCTSFVAARGRCQKHYAFGVCAYEECPTSALAVHGYCKKHGGGSKRRACSVLGCSTDARAHGVCTKHGGYATCKITGCSNQAQRNNVCKRHGAHGYCTEPGCGTVANNSRGFCCKHDNAPRVTTKHL